VAVVLAVIGVRLLANLLVEAHLLSLLFLLN
jgi:hypothetical protein